MDRHTSSKVTMPKWPAWILLATMAACTYPALTASAPAAQASASQPGGVAASR